MGSGVIDLKKATLQELREHTKDMKYDDRERTFAAALDTSELDTEEAAIIAVAQRIHREEFDCDTAMEMFIDGLLSRLMHRPLTLKDVQLCFEELEGNWTGALNTARKYYREYPELVAAGDDAQEDESTDDADSGVMSKGASASGD